MTTCTNNNIFNIIISFIRMVAEVVAFFNPFTRLGSVCLCNNNNNNNTQVLYRTIRLENVVDGSRYNAVLQNPGAVAYYSKVEAVAYYSKVAAVEAVILFKDSDGILSRPDYLCWWFIIYIYYFEVASELSQFRHNSVIYLIHRRAVISNSQRTQACDAGEPKIFLILWCDGRVYIRKWKEIRFILFAASLSCDRWHKRHWPCLNLRCSRCWVKYFFFLNCIYR